MQGGGQWARHALSLSKTEAPHEQGAPLLFIHVNLHFSICFLFIKSSWPKLKMRSPRRAARARWKAWLACSSFARLATSVHPRYLRRKWWRHVGLVIPKQGIVWCGFRFTWVRLCRRAHVCLGSCGDQRPEDRSESAPGKRRHKCQVSSPPEIKVCQVINSFKHQMKVTSSMISLVSFCCCSLWSLTLPTITWNWVLDPLLLYEASLLRCSPCKGREPHCSSWPCPESAQQKRSPPQGRSTSPPPPCRSEQASVGPAWPQSPKWSRCIWRSTWSACLAPSPRCQAGLSADATISCCTTPHTLPTLQPPGTDIIS